MVALGTADRVPKEGRNRMTILTRLPIDLATMRQRKGVSLEQIAQTTKIRTFWLQAIEEGRWHELPGGIYRRNYIRQYAEETGVDVRELLACCPSDLY